MGKLVVTGTLPLNQFWSAGGDSDADTTKVVFAQATIDGEPTEALGNGAFVRVKGKPKEVIHNGQLTVRSQGIDAPELHYVPSVRGAHNWRQHYGEFCTKELLRFLRDIARGAEEIPCSVVTFVEHPNDVFDMFGRFIGDIIVRHNGRDIDVNHWLVEQGLAFPTYYSSMSREEIGTIQALAERARQDRRGIWRRFSKHLQFDPDLLHRPGDAPDEDDRGPVVMPKVFRRLATTFAKHGDIGEFKADLESAHPQDWCYRTEEVLSQGTSAAEPHKLAEFVGNGSVHFAPGDLVFKEGASTLLDADGEPVQNW
jgi:endonuclease YncB( thermonuclease family)